MKYFGFREADSLTSKATPIKNTSKEEYNFKYESNNKSRRRAI